MSVIHLQNEKYLALFSVIKITVMTDDPSLMNLSETM